MALVDFHGVFIDPQAVIGISKTNMDHAGSILKPLISFDVHYNGTKMIVTVPHQESTDTDELGVKATLVLANQWRNELFKLVMTGEKLLS